MAPASLSDQTSVTFVNCQSYEPLAPGGAQYGYFITVALDWVDMVDSWGIPPQFSEIVQELWNGLGETSNDALIPEYPVPVVSNSRFDTSTTATIASITIGNAANLTAGELVRLIGQGYALNVIRLERVSVEAVRGKNKVELRAKADNEAEPDAANNNPIARAGDAIGSTLKTIGIGVGVALLVALVVLAVYFKPQR